MIIRKKTISRPITAICYHFKSPCNIGKVTLEFQLVLRTELYQVYEAYEQGQLPYKNHEYDIYILSQIRWAFRSYLSCHVDILF